MKFCLYVNKIKNFLLEILFPVKCLQCGKKNEILCDNCVSKIQITDRETNKNILAVFDYRDPIIKKAIWELKYHHKRFVGEMLGQLLYEFLIEEISDLKMNTPGKPIIIIPVPISNKRARLRWYNQSFFIAKGFCKKGDEIFELKDKIIFKKTNTSPQAKISNRKERLENIKGVFGVKNEKIVRGRTIIIIDDVTTTGGTINEIMKVLEESGAKRVIGFAVAH